MWAACIAMLAVGWSGNSRGVSCAMAAKTYAGHRFCRAKRWTARARKTTR